MNENERPELGTTEAAVRACVNLIALATHTGEDNLAYWLDLYYQTRVAHEKTAPTLDFSQLMNAQEPVLVKIEELNYKIETAARSMLKIEDLIRRDSTATPPTVEFTLDTKSIQEAAAAQKKNRAPLTTGERRKLQNAEKEKKRILGRGEWREFKRATFARLQEAKTGGLTIGAIVAASDGRLTENTVLDILNAAPRPIEDYRALDAALDRCAEI